MQIINRFLFRICLYGSMTAVFLLVLTYCISLLFSEYNKHSYFLGVIDKHERNNTNKESQLIIIGGSSNAFGVNSKKIQHEMQIPVMNYGVHGDFGFEFYASEARSEAKKGDIILATIEYELSSEESIYGEPEFYEMIFESNGKGFCYATLAHVYYSFFQFGNIIRKKTLLYINRRKPEIHPVYNREAFDLNGDLQSQPEKGEYKGCRGLSKLKMIDYTPSSRYIQHVVELKSYCEKRGITLLYSFPPIAGSAFNSQKSNKLYHMLAEAKIPMINKPESTIYCDSLFVGTCYHLCKEGREIYTRGLIENLKKIIR